MNSNVSQVFPFPALKSTHSSNASVLFLIKTLNNFKKVNKDNSPFSESEDNKILTETNQVNSAYCKDLCQLIP